MEPQVGQNQHSKKKKKAAHGAEHVEEGPWIVSYADMMTLLFCFFVIMTSFASFDPVTVAKKGADVAEHFVPTKVEGEKQELSALGIELGGHPNLKGSVRSQVKDSSLELSFSSSIMFKPGETKLRPEFVSNIDAMISLIKNKNPNYRIIIEGHTDSSPISENANFPSNWELSSARAAAIVQRFEYYGFKGEQLVSVGYGQTRPIAPNMNEDGTPNLDNQALNRRVVIKVLAPARQLTKSEKDSLYFDSSDILTE